MCTVCIWYHSFEVILYFLKNEIYFLQHFEVKIYQVFWRNLTILEGDEVISSDGLFVKFINFFHVCS